MQIPGDRDFFILFHFFQPNIFQDRQTSPNDSLKLIEIETYYVKPTNYAMVPQHGPFSLHTMLEGP